MRFQRTLTVALMSLFVLAGAVCAQMQMQNPPPPASAQKQPPPAPGTDPTSRMSPEMLQAMMQMMGAESRRPPTVPVRARESGGPFEQLSRLMSALDHPQARKMLGLSDQQADSLRKIVIDTETFSITTGAAIAVDAIQLNEILRADRPDRATVMAKGDAISKSTSQLISHYLQAMLSAKALLTPQQQETLRNYLGSANPDLSSVPRRP